MDFDLVDLCGAVVTGREFQLTWKQGAVCAPVAVARGYPGPYSKDDVISIDKTVIEKTGAKVFISGAARGQPAQLLTTGGRVLTVSAFGQDSDEARARAYKGIEAVSFEGMGFRRDIGKE
jgi:phosphoribosylamine--glycine ligase